MRCRTQRWPGRPPGGSRRPAGMPASPPSVSPLSRSPMWNALLTSNHREGSSNEARTRLIEQGLAGWIAAVLRR
jgi:hypothetical protein